MAHQHFIMIFDSVVKAGPDQFGSPANEAALDKIFHHIRSMHKLMSRHTYKMGYCGAHDKKSEVGVSRIEESHFI